MAGRGGEKWREEKSGETKSGKKRVAKVCESGAGRAPGRHGGTGLVLDMVGADNIIMYGQGSGRSFWRGDNQNSTGNLKEREPSCGSRSKLVV